MKRRRPEDALQRSVMQLLRIYEQQSRCYAFAVPNGGARSKTEAAIMKGLGVRAGVTDIVLMAPNRRNVFFLELKAPGRKASEAQRAFIAIAELCGHDCFVGDDFDAVRAAVDAWLAGDRVPRVNLAAARDVRA